MQATRRPFLLHFCSFLLLALLLLVSGCQPTQGLTMTRQHTADEFFSGPHLELARAIERNDMAALRRSAEGVDLTARGDKQMTLMWFALLQQNPDAVRTLVELGVHPSESPMEGMAARTPLGAALMSESTKYFEAMLDGGLSANDESGDGTPLLHRTITSGKLEHIKLLIQHGADINSQDSIGRSAFHDACLGTKPEIAVYLLEQGARVDTRLATGVTPAWVVYDRLQRLPLSEVRQGFETVSELMIERGVEFPPPSPLEVRERMRAEGLTPRVPPGHDR
ncbi:ankyrin repeat domain-containing protein [Billgrantia sp. LNSP4103-1]|uniref:ankyrin repeat domain-containing protein n=1 Tax=Billgrantia sp. LNSP4103-1 TaxID=3410266 RepID=UPI00403FA389